MSSRFDSIASEAAWAVYLSGFAETAGTSEDDMGYVFATVSAVTLLNIGEDDLSARLRAQYGDREVIVIAHETSTGFVRDDFTTAIVTGREMADAERYWSLVLAEIGAREDAAESEV